MSEKQAQPGDTINSESEFDALPLGTKTIDVLGHARNRVDPQLLYPTFPAMVTRVPPKHPDYVLRAARAYRKVYNATEDQAIEIVTLIVGAADEARYNRGYETDRLIEHDAMSEAADALRYYVQDTGVPWHSNYGTGRGRYREAAERVVRSYRARIESGE